MEENIEAIGDEITNIEINGNTILKSSEIEALKKKYIGKIGEKTGVIIKKYKFIEVIR